MPIQAHPTARRWGTIKQAADLLGVHRDTVRRMVARGEIYGERVSPRLIRVDLATIHTQPLAGGDAK